MIIDTSALLAFFDELEPQHAAVVAVIETADLCVVSPYVVVELDYLVASRYGRAAELAVLQELAGGDWELAALSDTDFASIVAVLEQYDQTVGVADAANLVLADRYHCDQIATLDRRHFTYLHLPGGAPLSIVP